VLPVCCQVKADALCLTPVCGMAETTHNYVEHPQLIAERLERAVGDRERVMAGTNCGFGTIVGDTQCPRTQCGPSSRRCATARPSRASGRGVEEQRFKANLNHIRGTP
jgi:hypothetical protein